MSSTEIPETSPPTPPPAAPTSASARPVHPVHDSDAQPPRPERLELQQQQQQHQEHALALGRARELAVEPGKGAGDVEPEPREIRVEARAGSKNESPMAGTTRVDSPVAGAGLKKSTQVDRRAVDVLDDAKVTVPRPSRLVAVSPSTVSRTEIVSPNGGIHGATRPQPIAVASGAHAHGNEGQQHAARTGEEER